MARPDRLSNEPPAILDLERGRKLLTRLRWTGRHVALEPSGHVAIRPGLGTAERFGQDVEAHIGDIVAVLEAEAAGNGS